MEEKNPTCLQWVTSVEGVGSVNRQFLNNVFGRQQMVLVQIQTPPCRLWELANPNSSKLWSVTILKMFVSFLSFYLFSPTNVWIINELDKSPVAYQTTNSRLLVNMSSTWIMNPCQNLMLRDCAVYVYFFQFQTIRLLGIQFEWKETQHNVKHNHFHCHLTLYTTSLTFLRSPQP